MRKLLRVSCLVISTVAVSTLAVSSAAVAGGPERAAPLTVLKTVSGPVPAGTTFTATLQCDDSNIDDGGEGTATAVVTFDATGQPTSPDTFYFNGPGSCTVTETATGGAATTTYACSGTIPVETAPSSDFSAQQGLSTRQQETPPSDPCEAAGPQAAPMGVIIYSPDQDATVTIANTFVAPTPSPAVVIQPAFTG